MGFTSFSLLYNMKANGYRRSVDYFAAIVILGRMLLTYLNTHFSRIDNTVITALIEGRMPGNCQVAMIP